jgi:hypothetical protein
VLIAFVEGYVVVDQLGVVDDPERNNCPAVEVPARIAPADDVELKIPPLLAVNAAPNPPLDRANGREALMILFVVIYGTIPYNSITPLEIFPEDIEN